MSWLPGTPSTACPASRNRVEEGAGLLELLGPGALGEVAADDDEVGLLLIHPRFDRVDQLVVMRAEVKVGQVDQMGHAAINPARGDRFPYWSG